MLWSLSGQFTNRVKSLHLLDNYIIRNSSLISRFMRPRDMVIKLLKD